VVQKIQEGQQFSIRGKLILGGRNTLEIRSSKPQGPLGVSVESSKSHERRAVEAQLRPRRENTLENTMPREDRTPTAV